MIMGIMKSFVFKLLLVGFAFAGACACGKTDRVDLEEELDPEVVEIPEVPETPSNPETPVTPVSPEDLYAYVPIRLTSSDMGIRDASNEFGFNVFGKLIKAADGKKDIVFSPLSLSLALSMAAEGAGGETYDQFSSVLGWGEASREEVGAFYAKMIEGLVTADKQVNFTCSNSLWAAKNLDIKEAYAEQLSKSFAAESFSVDFALSETLDRINEWCASKTNGKIQKMLDGLDEQTRMMLINALLFKAPWSVEWQVEKDRPFHGRNATAGKDFLHLDGSFYYRRF
jgi:serpin B